MADYLDYVNSTFIITDKGIMHFGIKGKSGRYPLGSGEDPYQGYPGMRRKKSTRINALNSNGKISKKEKREIERNKEAEDRSYRELNKIDREVQRRKSDPEYQRRRELALKYGKAKDISLFNGDLTNKEIDDALKRIDWEEKLSNKRTQELEAGYRRINNLFNKVGDVATWEKNIVNLGKNSKELVDFMKKFNKAIKKINEQSNQQNNNRRRS